MNNLGIKSFRQIIDEYTFVFIQIKKRMDFFDKLILKGYQIPSAGNYYKFQTLDDAYQIQKILLQEIDWKYILELMASLEAKLVYFFRYDLKRKSDLGRIYRSEVPSIVISGGKHLMFQDIVKIFKTYMQPIDNIAYADFKNLIELRNWLAHGCAWDFTIYLNKFDFNYAYEAIIKIISYLPQQTVDLKQ